MAKFGSGPPSRPKEGIFQTEQYNGWVNWWVWRGGIYNIYFSLLSGSQYEIYEWLEENMPERTKIELNNPIQGGYLIYFKNKEDAAAFKIRWA